jgi:hypothetical protein
MFDHLTDEELEVLIDGLVALNDTTYPTNLQAVSQSLYSRLNDEADVRSIESRESTIDPWTYN